MKAKRRRRLLPLLIVTSVVVGALSGLVYALAGARERARRVYCEGALRSLAYGLQVYSADYGEAFPPTLGHLYPQYAMSVAFLCTNARKAIPVEDNPRIWRDGVRDRQHFQYTPAMFGDTHSDYVYVSGLKAADPGHYVLAFDDEWNHDGDGLHVLTIGVRIPWVRDIKALRGQLAKQEKELAAKGRKMKLLRPAWSRYPELPPPRPWYSSPGGRGVAVGAFVGIALGLVLVVRTAVWGGKPASEGPPGDTDRKNAAPNEARTERGDTGCGRSP